MSDWITVARGEPQPAKDFIRQFVVPLLVIHNKEPIAIGGSAFLWQTLEGRFIVTANHVWTELEARVAGNKGFTIGFPISFGIFVVPRLTVIDRDEDKDLCIVSSADLWTAPLGDRRFYGAEAWPCAEPFPNDWVGVYGFPGALRHYSREGFLSEGLYVQQPCEVSRAGTIYLNTSPKRKLMIREGLFPKRIPNLGGMSGAPAFVLNAPRAGWVGIVRSGSGEEPKDFMMRLAPVSCITAAGTIVR